MHDLTQKLDELTKAMEGKSSQDVFDYIINNSHHFKKFVEDNKNKSLEDIVLAYNLDLDIIKRYI